MTKRINKTPLLIKPAEGKRLLRRQIRDVLQAKDILLAHP